MPRFNGQLICPFCFNQFTADKIRFRCIYPKCPKMEPDPIFAHVRGYGVTKMGRVLVPKKQAAGRAIPRAYVCDACDQESYTRLCPNCHFELPEDIGQIDQRIIAIIGGRATGKTHYIASLITHVKYVVGNSFDITIQTLGDETQQRWERDFYTPLFVRRTVLQPTRPAMVDPQVKTPLIFRVSVGQGRHRRDYNMSFFDTAGEDMNSFATMSTQNRYINYADGIVFLLDPLQIPSVRQSLSGANFPPMDDASSPENIVDRVCLQFKRISNLNAYQKISVPVAFTISKVDELFSLLDPGSAIRQPSEHHGSIDLGDMDSINTEIANYLETWISPNFCQTIDRNFATYQYFGVSSLGGQPKNNRLQTVSPMRVEDPFLWILYKMGLVTGRKG